MLTATESVLGVRVKFISILDSIINSLIIVETLLYKIPPNLPLPKGGIIYPSLKKRGEGRFSE
jgi:hypothetical protein